jgi:hypothetical protein
MRLPKGLGVGYHQYNLASNAFLCPIDIALGVLDCCKRLFNRGVKELTRSFAEFFLVLWSFFATCGGGRWCSGGILLGSSIRGWLEVVATGQSVVFFFKSGLYSASYSASFQPASLLYVSYDFRGICTKSLPVLRS